jgi:hypothetical protein
LVVGATVLCVLAGASGSASPFNKTTYLKFSGPVALPGVSLGAGEYVFELADPNIRNVVRVTNRQGTKVYTLAMTRLTHRPATAKTSATVVLGETRPGAPTPIKTWFPEGERIGHEFIY